MGSKQSGCAPSERPGSRGHVVWIRLRRGWHGWFESPEAGDVKPPEPVPARMVRQMELFVNEKGNDASEAA